jgi:hypothetical protein
MCCMFTMMYLLHGCRHRTRSTALSTRWSCTLIGGESMIIRKRLFVPYYSYMYMYTQYTHNLHGIHTYLPSTCDARMLAPHSKTTHLNSSASIWNKMVNNGIFIYHPYNSWILISFPSPTIFKLLLNTERWLRTHRMHTTGHWLNSH